jgi:hypothetical protein
MVRVEIKMSIDSLTIGEAKQLASLFGGQSRASQGLNCLNCMIGKKVIVRTYSAGVWFGELEQKAGNEVIIKSARRMWKWWAAESISLSAVAIYGVKHKESKIVEAVPLVWLEAIELIPCSDAAIKSLESAPNVKAE